MEKHGKLKVKQTTKLPKGFQLSGVKANIKYKNRLDLALIYSEVSCKSAGVWTQNSVQAACITYNKANIQNDIHAILVNAGCANACTGGQGEENCKITAEGLAKLLRLESKQVLLASTGVIGVQLPISRILKSLPKLIERKNNNKDSIKVASRAIMTTDTFAKTYGVDCKISQNEKIDSKDSKTNKMQVTQAKKNVKQKFRIWGMAKGSGMIHPNMATMLGFILTDVAIAKNLLQDALSEITKQTFNQISVDGDTSTNDMVIVLANGEAKNKEITTKNADYDLFRAGLKKVCTKLAKQIAGDGEGATHLLEVSIKNAKNLEQAQLLSKSIIGSNLVKTAIFGKDANWGRIICAMGYSNAEFNASKFDLVFESKKGKITIVKNGASVPFNEGRAKNILSDNVIRIIVDLQDGKCSAKAWGCDLSYDYIKINADYRS